MLRAIISYVCLRRLRRRAPHLFDGELAARAVAECIAEEEHCRGFS